MPAATFLSQPHADLTTRDRDTRFLRAGSLPVA